MALQVWLPLNGDVKNQGLCDVVVNTNNVSTSTSGKIGKCYSFNGDSSYISLASSGLFNCFKGGTVPFSISMWIYNNETSGNRAVLFGDFGIDGAVNFNIEINGIGGPADCVRFYWNASPDLALSSTIISPGKWSHLTITYSGSTLKAYLNGSLTNTQNIVLNTMNKTSGMFLLGRDGRTGTTAFNGSMNDFRIYNHCLSPKEVKEISKGLVLHYKMDDGCLKTANNLVTGLTGGGQCTISNNTVTISGSNSDTYFYLNTSAALTSGKTYKISCVGHFDDGKYYYFPIGGQSNTSPGQLLVKNGYCSLVFTANSTIQNCGTQIIMDDTSRSSGAGTITNITLEEVNGIWDCSGFGYNGIAYGNLIIDSDTSRYSSSIKFPATTTDYIEMNNNSVFSALDNCTISWWGKYDGARSLLLTGQDTSYFVAAGSPSFYHSNVSGTLSYYVDGTKLSSVPSYTSGQWHHYTITGVNITSWTKFLLNHYGDYTQWGIQGKISDFRIYATPLSAEDVKELYNTSAMVCDNGTVMAYSLEE